MAEATAQAHRINPLLFHPARDVVLNVSGGDTRFERLDAGFLHFEDGAVDFFLFGGEFARDRPGAGNVHGEIIQVAAEIHQDQLTSLHPAVISIVVHDAGVWPGTDNRSISWTAAAVAEDDLHDSSFKLVFVSSGTGGQHGSFDGFG